jgi:hypothetical protein
LRECDTGTCVALVLLLPEWPFTTVPELDSACMFDSCGENFKLAAVLGKGIMLLINFKGYLKIVNIK